MRQVVGLLTILLSSGAMLACGAPAEADDSGVVSLASSERGLTNRVGVATTGGTVAAEGEDADDDKPKDYWAAVDFDRTNFEEVRQQVRRHYIDTKVPDAWAYAQAGSFALGSFALPPVEGDDEADDKKKKRRKTGAKILLPERFYKARKSNADEKGMLKGKMQKLHPNDKFVLLSESDHIVVDEKKKRLTDDEIRGLRDRQKARQKLLRETWAETGFDGKDFDRVMRFIKREYKPNAVWTMKKGWIAASQGYLYGLDPHSSLVSKAAWDESTRRTRDSSFDGIGAILTQRPSTDFTIVESPIQGQPAVTAGLRAGDEIRKVDSKSIKGEPLSKVVSRIRGKRGTPVILTVQREGEPETRDISITRAHIEIKNVQGRMVEGHEDFGYIKVTGFIRSTNDDLERVYRELSNKTKSGRLRGLVLDMRDNSGGLLNQGIAVSDRFVSDGIIVSVRNRNSHEDESYRAKRAGTWDVPVVVLVNDGTASAAEIVASAIQDNQRGLVIGDRTFGKASVQTLYTPVLQDDYYIKLTVARYYSPSGRTLQVTGVLPDITVVPEFGKPMPLGFREENLSGHLVPLDFDYTSANKALADRAQACAKKSGIATKLHDADPNPAIKFDYQLQYGGDMLECSIAERAAAKDAPPRK